MKIVLAVDGSAHSTRAEKLLSVLTGSRRHQVTALYVTPVVHRSSVSGQESITQALEKSGREMVEAVATEVKKWSGLRVASKVIRSNDVAGAVLDHAAKARARLITVGARGLTPLKTFFLGSVSQRVSRHADASVLVARKEPKGGVLNVLVAVDGSPSSRRVSAFLPAIGLPKNSRVTLIHVVDDPLMMWGPEIGLAGDYGALAVQKETLALRRKKGKRVLEDARRSLSSHFSRLETVLAEGHTAGEILRAAEGLSCDMIIMGRRGLSKLDRFFMGSVSQKVSAYAGCSVLVVH